MAVTDNPNQYDDLVSRSSMQSAIITQEYLIPQLLYPDPRNLPQQSYKVPPDCPKSLEPLCQFENLIIHRRPENAIDLSSAQHTLLAFVQYDIVNSDGKQLYVAVEQTTHNAVTWYRDARLFNITLYDQKCKNVLTIKRPWTCCFCFAQYYCFCCLFGFRGCGSKANVTLCDGNKKLGHISQRFSCKQTCLDIYDNNGKHILSIFGRLADGIFDIILPQDEDEDEPIAMIETSMTTNELADFYKIKFSEYEDPYGITFFIREISASNKALIISAVILMDYILCKPNGDHPSWVQFIPSDFKSEPSSYEKVFKDESKEIIVTSMRPKHRRHRQSHRKNSCCHWFCGFICICCPIGMARNSLRCFQLLVSIFLIIFLVLFLIIFHEKLNF